MKTLLLTTLLLCGSAMASGNIAIHDDSAWVRANPPGTSTTAIYLTLMNTGADDKTLTSVAADISDRIELHTHKQHDGMMKMQQVESIAVPAGNEAILMPHGDHIMVFNLDKQLEEGEKVDLTLLFADGTELTVSVPVLKQGPSDSGEHMKHTSGEHGSKKHDDHAKHGNTDKQHDEHKTH